MKKDRSSQKQKGVKACLQKAKGSITIVGKRVQISTATVPSSKGASPRQIIKAFKKAAKEGVFPEPTYPITP